MLRLIVLLIFASALPGCGNKGPLYLPDTDSMQNQKPAAAAPLQAPSR